MGDKFFRDAIKWAWIIVQMIIEAIGYLADIFAEYWFLAIILAFLIIAWYLGLL